MSSTAPIEQAPMNVVLEYDIGALSPLNVTNQWLAEHKMGDRVTTKRNQSSIIISGVRDDIYGLVDALKEAISKQDGPNHLLMAVVPDRAGGMPSVLSGSALKRQQEHVAATRGRKTALRAMSNELGDNYWQRMTNPDLAKDD